MKEAFQTGRAAQLQEKEVNVLLVFWNDGTGGGRLEIEVQQRPTPPIEAAHLHCS